MNRRDFPTGWLLAILLLSLLLVACERPLQEEVTLEAVTPAAGEEPVSTPSETEPGGGPAPTPVLEATPSPAAENGEVSEPGEQPTTEEPGATEEAPPDDQPTGPTEDVVHTVVAGETLGTIADRYGVTVEVIAQANNLVDVNSLEVGQQLLIPLSGNVDAGGDEEGAGQEQVHIVQSGETLFRIGQQYGFSVEALVAYNNLANPDRLEVGQEIRIPPAGYTVDQ